MRGKKMMFFLIPVVCAVLIGAIILSIVNRQGQSQPVVVQSKSPAISSAAWTATPYMDERGKVIEGLESAVQGKKNWIETTQPMPAVITVDEGSGTITLTNGAITRVLHFAGKGETGFYTSSYRNEYTQKELSGTAMLPEAMLGLYDKPYREIYSGEEILFQPVYYYVGGTNGDSTFLLDNWQVYDTCEVPFAWRPNTQYGDPAASIWPPKGKRLEVLFKAPEDFPAAYQGLEIKLIYELYDNLAAMKKRVEITNKGDTTVTVGRLATEILGNSDNMQQLMMLETSYSGGNESTIPFNTPLPCACGEQQEDSPMKALAGTVHACYELGPAYQLDGGKDMTFSAFDTYELVYSTYWFEQRALERLGMYRRLFPWITDNPLTFHSTEKLTKKLIHHAAEAGFELIIQSFSVKDASANMLTTNQKVLDSYKELVDYAHSKNISIGIYQAQYQLDQYKTSPEYSANGKGTWGTWCLASAGFDDYYDKFLHFVSYTGLDCVEIDGPYPNCVCDNGEKHQGTEHAKHAVHYGYYDSQVKQWENATRLLCASLKNLGVYIQVPAWYYMNGGNKCGIGYEEIAWSESRQEQLIYGRQIMYNASYARTMSMSWTHVPFKTYHGGGKAAAFYPFRKNKADYNWIMAQNLGNGVTGVFRGKRLYDSDTLKTAQKWVNFYKEHRAIINGDMVHISQAAYIEGNKGRTQSFDTLFHVNPAGAERGLLWVYNQSDSIMTGEITVPMYYTGLTNLNYPQVPVPGSLGKDVYHYGEYPPNYDWLPSQQADYRLPEAVNGRTSGKTIVIDEAGNEKTYSIDSNGNLHIIVTLQPMSFTYFIMK